MPFPCDKCEINKFCEDIGRCFEGALYDCFGESDMKDIEDDEVAESAKIKPVILEDKKNGKLSSKEQRIIFKAIQ